MSDQTNGGRQPAPSMATEPSDINAKLLARMKVELDKPADMIPPRPVVVEKRRSSPKEMDAPPLGSRVSDYAPPDQRPDTVTRALGPLPPYVTHAPDASRAAQIASHAIAVEYETLALECERKGLELHDRINAVLQDTIETARFFRERGATLFRQIETSFALAAEVAAGNKQMRERIISVDHIETPAAESRIDSVPESIPEALAEKVDAVVREARAKE
jgi:hypothetical protein